MHGGAASERRLPNGQAVPHPAFAEEPPMVTDPQAPAPRRLMRRRPQRKELCCALLATALLGACGKGRTTSPVEPPGEDTRLDTSLLDAGAAALQPEKLLWHSHVHEVKSGQLIAPGLPVPAENALMGKLVDTYGKTWHTWHTDLHRPLPLGAPQLMMGFTRNWQADPEMVARRDQRFGVDSRQRRDARADIAAPPVAAGADAWERGQAVQIGDPTGAHGTER
jgi:Protein of unknown function (DUF1264)